MDLMMTEESRIIELLEYCTDATNQFIRLMAETGADMVSNGDSPAGPEEEWVEEEDPGESTMDPSQRMDSMRAMSQSTRLWIPKVRLTK